MTKAYFIRGNQYSRFDVEQDHIDSGYPKALTNGWAGIDATGFAGGFDTAIDLGTGKLYLFLGSNYVRADHQSNAIDGPVTPIAGNWGGLAEAGFGDGLDAAINWGDGTAYFFKGDAYIQYTIGGDAVIAGPAPIAGNWPGMAEAGFGDGLDAAINLGNGAAYFFKGGSYVRYTIGVGVAESYAVPIADNWSGFSAAGLANGVDASWVKLVTGATPPPPSAGLGPGDHVWYYNGQISTDKNVPRASWFPGSNPGGLQ
jgi:hypothetical protein